MNDDTTPSGPAEAAPDVHLYVLLDRSGSMGAIADDVVGGFNRLLADQQADGADALMTLVQFDSQDAQEVLADAVPIREVLPLDAVTFRPRGGTPLLDATGLLLGRADRRARERSRSGLPAEEVVVVSITDGHENQSQEYTLGEVRRRVEERTADGWTFVFLSAAMDAYAEAGGLGYDARSSQAWDATGAGSHAAFASLSRATSSHRSKVRRREVFDKGDFFEGDKGAEAQRRERGS